MMRRGAIAVGLWLFVGCGGAAPSPPGGAHDELEAGAVTLTSVMTFDVTVPSASATFVRAYADGTHLPLREENGAVVAGPFLSRYEATFVAGCAGGARVTMHDTFDEPATPEPFLRAQSSSPTERTLVEVETRRVLGERFALVTWEAAAPTPPTDAKDAKDAKDAIATPGAPAREYELYIVHGSTPRLVARLAREIALDMPAAGLVAARTPRDVVYLSPASAERSDALRGERVVGWRDGPIEREMAFDRSLFTFTRPAGGVPVVTVARIAPAPSGLELERFRVELQAADPGTASRLGAIDWDSAERASAPATDLCRVVQATAEGRETVSLE
ncbi:MAG TPA: hypothetical protein VL400_15260 [Polyangiaceae bacterium]|nr:hypothetical protein [Polyangiaceae bacterium]